MQFWALCWAASVALAGALAAEPPAGDHVEHHDVKAGKYDVDHHHTRHDKDEEHHVGHHGKKEHGEHHGKDHDKDHHGKDHHHDKDHDKDHHGKDHHDKDHDDDHHDKHHTKHYDHIKYTEKHDHDLEVKNLVEHLNKIAYRFGDLEHKLDERKDPELLAKAGTLEHRVEVIEGGNGCERKDYFQCGGNDPQCINNLLVCDHNKDCRNGEDEEDCDLHIHVGDSFVGDSIFDHCTQRRPDHMTVTFTAIKNETFFPGFPKLAATIDMEYETDHAEGHVTLRVKGGYSFARNRFIFVAPEADRLGFIGQFDGSDFDHFVGTIQPEATQIPCAKFYFRRHTEDEDEE